MALQRRQEQVATQKKILEETKASQQKYQEEPSGHSGRKRWDGREEEREKQREVTLVLKDKEKEVEAIKVIDLCAGL